MKTVLRTLCKIPTLSPAVVRSPRQRLLVWSVLLLLSSHAASLWPGLHPCVLLTPWAGLSTPPSALRCSQNHFRPW